MVMRTLQYGKDDLKAVVERQGLDYSSTVGYVKGIVDSVRKNGDRALLEYTQKFDNVELGSVIVTKEEINRAHRRLGKETLTALEVASRNIRKLHIVQYKNIKKEWICGVSPGVKVGERITPLESVGCYVPGGRAAYPSTVLMTCVPAKIAGVKRIVVVSPPPIPDSVLAACKIADVDEVYRVGGAHAIAALAYGTESIKPVDKVVGPGNKYVTAAKMLVYGAVDIDMPAGPSEVLVIADDTADPGFIASDIMAQAEHDPNAQCILVTTSVRVADKVGYIVGREMMTSEKREILFKSLENFTIVLVKSLAEAVEFANQYAPEHLEIQTKKADVVGRKIVNAGAVFIGPYSPVAAGDYASGANHVLPTSGAARFSSPLSIRDFLKYTSIQKITKDGLKKLAQTITTLAQREGLTEHRRSVERRLA